MQGACDPSLAAHGVVPSQNTVPSHCSSVAPPACRSSGTTLASSSVSPCRNAPPIRQRLDPLLPSRPPQAVHESLLPPSPGPPPRYWQAPRRLVVSRCVLFGAVPSAARWQRVLLQPPRAVAPTRRKAPRIMKVYWFTGGGEGAKPPAARPRKKECTPTTLGWREFGPYRVARPRITRENVCLPRNLLLPFRLWRLL